MSQLLLQPERTLSQNSLWLPLLRKIASLPPSVWRTEAVRLLSEFCRTGKAGHLRAFIRHRRGIKARLGVDASPGTWRGGRARLEPPRQLGYGSSLADFSLQKGSLTEATPV